MPYPFPQNPLLPSKSISGLHLDILNGDDETLKASTPPMSCAPQSSHRPPHTPIRAIFSSSHSSVWNCPHPRPTMVTLGNPFRVTTYGESHCARPPSNLTTPRTEKDKIQIPSGVQKGITLGTPIAMRVQNQDQRTHDYTEHTLDLYPRPSHANYAYLQKYGVKASSGGGRQLLRADLPSLLLTATLFLQQLFLPLVHTFCALLNGSLSGRCQEY
ncbi:hypothetical protein V8E36_007282 [Tilletia maclaganii]